MATETTSKPNSREYLIDMGRKFGVIAYIPLWTADKDWSLEAATASADVFFQRAKVVLSDAGAEWANVADVCREAYGKIEQFYSSRNYSVGVKYFKRYAEMVRESPHFESK